MKIKLASIIGILLALAATLPAQDTRGAISDRITDQSGATIPGASVVVENTAIGLRSTSKTDANGNYQALFLPPGPYRIEAVAQ